MENSLEAYIASLMEDCGWTWKLEGNSIQPDSELIRKNLDGLKAMLYDEEPGAQVMLGRLIVVKRAKDKFDIYLMVGEDNGTGV